MKTDYLEQLECDAENTSAFDDELNNILDNSLYP